MAKAIFIMDMSECCAGCQLADDDPSGLYCMIADDYYDGSDSFRGQSEFLPASEIARVQAHDR